MRFRKETTMAGETAHDRSLWCGLGRCGRCSCPSFKGRGNICEDCGHRYDDHGTSPFRASVRRDAVWRSSRDYGLACYGAAER
jgi:hypothetical protein